MLRAPSAVMSFALRTVGTFAILLGVAAGATAQVSGPSAVTYDVDHPYSVEVSWGFDNQFSGKMITGGSGLSGGANVPVGVPITLDETTYDEVYGRMGLFKLSFSYQSTPRIENVGSFVISRSSSEPVVIGTIGTPGTPLTAKFDDYNYWGIEGGQRFHFTQARFTPYAGYYLGINRFDHIDADITASTVPPTSITAEKFFDSSWAFSFGPNAGVLVGFGKIQVMGQIDLRFMGGLSDVDALVEEGLKDINKESSRWSLPISFGVRYRF